MKRTRRMIRKSGFAPDRKLNELLSFRSPSLGQSYPQQCPPAKEVKSLGKPLSLRGVATLIGCSAWSVRQALIPMGLPVFRSRAGGKLIFYQDQVVRWIESRQQGGKT